jgi:hypothetical protein
MVQIYTYEIKWRGNMYYVKRNYKDGSNLKEIYVEVNAEGRVTREIEFDVSGKVIHKCPAKGFKNGTYGLFDNVPFDTKNLKNDLTKDAFEKFWDKKSRN